jgi:hypothetical protein
MNERIKELADEAGLRFTQLMSNPMVPVVDGKETDLEKFAELIVKECRDIVEQDMKLAHIQMIPLTLEKYANGRLKEKIREHFGVEE